jgi:rhomboid protease GluP
MDWASCGKTTRQIVVHCLARQGFSLTAPAEATALKSACDVVLARLQWSQLHIICLVDGESHPGKHFAMEPRQAEAIASACRKYSGSFGGLRVPVLLEIVEVSVGPPSAEDLTRLGHYRRSSILSKGMLLGVHIAAGRRRVRRNSWPLTISAAGRALRARPVLEVEVQAASANQAPALVPVHAGWPVVTLGIVVLLAVVYGVEVVVSGEMVPSFTTLLSLGGINHQLVFAGEWWRVISATLLHQNLGHLAANGVALLFAGKVLEGMAGHAWFAAVYILSSLAGALSSILLGQTFGVAVGASGGVIGVAAAALVIGLTRKRRESGGEALLLLVGLIPTLGLYAWDRTGAMHVDHFAHFGGMLGGVLAALAILGVWNKAEAAPGWRGAALSIAGLGCLALIVAVAGVARHRTDDDVALVPGSALPHHPAQRNEKLAALVSQFPGDPRTHHALAWLQAKEGRYGDAELSLRKALSLDRALALYFDPSLAGQIRGSLAAILVAEHKEDEARDIMRPLCGLPANAPGLNDQVRALRASLCLTNENL